MRKYGPFIFLLLSSCTARQETPDYLFVTPPLAKRTEPFTLSFFSKVERLKLLIVWDTSGSMNTKQKEMQDFFFTFFNIFFKSRIEWELGIVNTDRLHKRSFIVKKDEAEGLSPKDLAVKFKNDLVTLVQEETESENDEHALYNMLNFLQENPSFLDLKAFLAVIIITDERAHTTQGQLEKFVLCQEDCHERTKADLILEKIYTPREKNGYGKKEGEVRFYGILEPKEQEEFVPLIHKTKGSLDDINKVGVQTYLRPSTLQNMAMEVFSEFLDVSAILKKRPIVHCLEVTYKEELVPSGTYWFYKREANALIFHNLNFSQENENVTVQVSYTVDNGGVRCL